MISSTHCKSPKCESKMQIGFERNPTFVSKTNSFFSIWLKLFKTSSGEMFLESGKRRRPRFSSFTKKLLNDDNDHREGLLDFRDILSRLHVNVNSTLN